MKAHPDLKELNEPARETGINRLQYRLTGTVTNVTQKNALRDTEEGT